MVITCCEVMLKYRKVVGSYYTAGAEHETAATVTADKTEINLSTGYDFVMLQLNYCPNCGIKQ